MSEKKNIMEYETVALDEENLAVVIIDQTKLPGRTEIISLKTAQEIWDAIYLLQVRGAPAIGVAAAFGIYVLAEGMEETDYDSFLKEFQKQKEYLDSARPYGGQSFVGVKPDGAGCAGAQDVVCGRDQGAFEKRGKRDQGRGRLGVQNDRRVRSDARKARRRHINPLQCGTAGDQQVRDGDGSHLSGTGKGLQLPCFCG